MKDIIKVIKSLENRGILLKGTTKKLLVQKEDFKILLGRFTINKKCTHSIS